MASKDIFETVARQRYGLFALLMLAMAACTNAGNDNNESGQASQDEATLSAYFATLPGWQVFDPTPGNTQWGNWIDWNSVPQDVKVALNHAAQKFVEGDNASTPGCDSKNSEASGFRGEWGEDALRKKETKVLVTPLASNEPWSAGVYAVAQSVFGLKKSEVDALEASAQGASNLASTEIGLLKRFWLATLIFRSVGPDYLQLPDIDWDGQSFSKNRFFFPLSDAPTIRGQKKFASEVEQDFLAFINANHNSPLASARAARVHLRQLATGSIGWKLGSDQLLTPYGVGMWYMDIAAAFDSGKLDANATWQYANAFLHMNGLDASRVNNPGEFDIKDLAASTIQATFGARGADRRVTNSGAAEFIDMPSAQSVLGTSDERLGTILLHLMFWFHDKLDVAVAAKPYWEKSDEEIHDGWSSLFADLFLETSVDAFRVSMQSYLDKVQEDQNKVKKAIAQGSLSTQWLTRVGGPDSSRDQADTRMLQALNERFRDFLLSYGPTFGDNGALGHAMHDIGFKVSTTSGNTSAHPLGNYIQIGLRTPEPQSLYSMYRAIAHEYYHALDSKLGSNTSMSPMAEGGPVLSETLVVDRFIAWLNAVSTNGEKNEPWFIAQGDVSTYKADQTLFIAGYQMATVDGVIHTMGENNKESGMASWKWVVDRAQNYWFTTDERAERAAMRAHWGFSFLQYVAGPAVVTGPIGSLAAKYSAYVVDPYSLLACRIYDPKGNESGLESCLPKR